MKSNTTNQSREISLTVDGIYDRMASTWSKIRSSKLTIRVGKV
jgi:hypothetical protein